MNSLIKYIELKTGYSDNGPAWIGKVKFSKSKKTIYFNNKAFMKITGIYGNYMDIETREEYWISGVKKDGMDRHWTGSGKIIIEKNIVNEYLKLIESEELDDRKYIIEDIPEIYPIERIEKILNLKL
jgi:hypothetical protein